MKLTFRRAREPPRRCRRCIEESTATHTPTTMAGDPDPFDMLKPIKPKSAVPKPRGAANGHDGGAETLEEFASSGGATSTEETEKKTEELLERINEIVGASTDLFDAPPEPWIDEPSGVSRDEPRVPVSSPRPPTLLVELPRQIQNTSPSPNAHPPTPVSPQTQVATSTSSRVRS